VAFLACILGVIGWFRPVAPDPVAAPSYSDEEVAAATAKVCAAFEEAWTAISVTSQAEAGDDTALEYGYAANARLAVLAGGMYLRDKLDPAVPVSLDTQFSKFSDSLVAMTVLALTGTPKYDSEYRELKESVVKQRDLLKDRCR